ncbi:hypothetical protein [Actinomyces viscosus]|uniref:Uncharacterized protein n=1 Tax=Actinomyces viscosus TaxID=1656 RepID=A0A3S4VF40_ACTVI|nr:hypothetical protein [Actinomyces viscosus]VEI17418.1 Uncharacterised protein [Actinomyces viscosus]
MASTHNRKQSAVGYALIGGFVLLFIFLNWAGPGRILSLVSAVTVLMTLLSIRTRSRAATLAAVILMVTLPFVALRTHAGSVVGATGPLVIFVGVACWRRWKPRSGPRSRDAHESAVATAPR